MLEIPSKQQQAHHIPSDLIENIMSMLPVKSLLRFRSLSKSWKSFIDEDREFHLRHLCSFNKAQQQKLQILEHGSNGRKRVVTVSTNTFARLGSSVDLKIKEPMENEYRWGVVCAVDGLYMLRNYKEGVCEFILWNPSIRKYRMLPPPPPQPPSVTVTVYDIGLGFDPMTKDYKYVGFTRQMSCVWIYSLGTNSWKPNSLKPNGCPQLFGQWMDSKVCFAGVLYSLHGSRTNVLASYNLSTDEFCCTDLPYEGCNGPYHYTLTLANAGTCLALVTVFLDEFRGTMWLSQELRGQDSLLISWTKAYTFASKIPESHPFDGHMRFLHLNHGDPELLLSWNGFFLTSYNLKTHQGRCCPSLKFPTSVIKFTPMERACCCLIN